MRRYLALLSVPVLLLLGLFTAAPAQAVVVSGGALTSGTAVTGTVTVAQTDIAYTFAGTAGAHVTFDVTASTWGTGTARLYIYSPSGSLFHNCALTSSPSYCELSLNSTGTWKVVLDPYQNAVGKATFKFANDQAKGALTAGTPITTVIAIKGQNASYTFAATGGLHTAFNVTASSWNTAARLMFYNPTGTLITYCNLGSAPSQCDLTPTVTGTWKIVLDPTGAAVGSTTFVYTPDLNKGPLTSGTSITTAIIGAGQNASYTFAGVNGKHVTFDTTAASWGTGQANLNFFRPTGPNSFYFSCSSEAGATCEFTPDMTGAWKVSLDPIGAAVGSTTFTYAADLEKGALTAGTAVTTAPAVRGQNASFTFAGTDGAHEDLSVTASNWGDGAANLEVYAPNGQIFTYCVLETGPVYCDFTPNATGTWKVVLDPQGAAVGSTTFALVHDQAKGALTAGTSIGTAISTKGQNATYTMPGTADVSVSFLVSASNWGQGAATLNLLSADGSVYDYCILSVGATTCQFTPNVTGTWKVLLDPYEGAVGSTTFKYIVN